MRQGHSNNRRPRGGRNGMGGGMGGAPVHNAGGGGMRGGSNSRSGVPLRHQSFESNGPDIRVRGNAYQVYEKYLSLARDAASGGDRIMAENYLQHAEHYFRVIQAINEAAGPDPRAEQRPEQRNDHRSESRPDQRQDSRSDTRSDSQPDGMSSGISDGMREAGRDSRSESRQDYRQNRSLAGRNIAGQGEQPSLGNHEMAASEYDDMEDGDDEGEAEAISTRPVQHVRQPEPQTDDEDPDPHGSRRLVARS